MFLRESNFLQNSIHQKIVILLCVSRDNGFAFESRDIQLMTAEFVERVILIQDVFLDNIFLVIFRGQFLDF